MTDLVDAMMGALGLVERFVQLRQKQARMAIEEWNIEIDEEIDGLAEIERIRAAAGLAPYQGWPSVRRPTSGRWSPDSPTTDVREEPATGPVTSTAPEPPPEPPPIDLDFGPREHVEGNSEAGVDVEGTDAPVTVDSVDVEDAEAPSTATIDAEIIAVIDAADVGLAAVIDAEAIEVAEVCSPHEQLDLFADLLAVAEDTEVEAIEESITTPSDEAAPITDEPESTPIALHVVGEPEPSVQPEPIEVHALAAVAPQPTQPSAEEQALREALMKAEAARARPSEARRLYEEVLIVAARHGAPFPQTLFVALALLGTSECDLELGDLDAAMANSGDAWSWARRAHGQHPSDETLQVLSLTAQTFAQAAERSGDRQQLAEVVAECLSVIEPELAHRDLPAARDVRLGLRSRLMKLTRPATTSLVRKGALTPSLTLTTMQGVRP